MKVNYFFPPRVTRPMFCSYALINRQSNRFYKRWRVSGFECISIFYTSEIQITLCYSRLIFFNNDHSHFILWLVNRENPHFAILLPVLFSNGCGARLHQHSQGQFLINTLVSIKQLCPNLEIFNRFKGAFGPVPFGHATKWSETRLVPTPPIEISKGPVSPLFASNGETVSGINRLG